MTYERINFVDQSVERPRTYEMTHNADGSVTLVDSFGLINELGTPINADTMNHLEDGIDSKQDKLVAGDNIILEKNVISAKSGSMAIGTIISVNASDNYVPDGCLPCDGAEYSQIQFNDLWNNFLINDYLKTCTYSDYEADLTTYGQCSKFAVDSSNGKFKVPTINKVLTDIADTVGVLGNGKVIEYTNGTDTFSLVDTRENGIFPKTNAIGLNVGENTPTSGGTLSKHYTGIGLSQNEETSGIIADTTNTKTYSELRFFVVVANGQTNQSMMDWSAWASSLQSRLNIDITNISDVGKSNITDLLSPDYSAGVEKVWGETYTAEVSGWLYYAIRFATKASTTIDDYTCLWIDEIPVGVAGGQQGGANSANSGLVKIAKGSTYRTANPTGTGYSTQCIRFYPDKGVN